MSVDGKALYPDISGDVLRLNSNEETKVFRLKKIEEIRSLILKERDHRERTYKKIKRVIDTINYVEIGLEGLGAIAGAVSIPALLGVISAPVGLVLEGTFIGAFGVDILLRIASRRLSAKLKKHDQIKILADSKLNTIEEYVSQAINDGDISHEEFILITRELAKFNELKQKIRTKTSTKLQKIKNDTDFEKEVKKRVDERLAKEKKSLIEKLTSSNSR